jgi:hypothetical protein
MPEIKLKIDDLVLDHDNPRITHAEGQQDALQKIVRDQKIKLLRLAQSIVDHGLSPADNLLVLRVNQKPERFISLEGNRRIAALKLLTNPAVMSGLDMPAPTKRALEKLAKQFKRSKVEPISCHELPSREAGRYWLRLRHSTGHDGAGVEPWKSLAKRRFDGKPPAVQALELVTERAGLTPAEASAITENFPTSTLERLLENRKVQKELGISIKGGKLVTQLPADEVAKPLKKIVLDLATKRKHVGMLMKTDDMLKYVTEELGSAHRPDLGKARGPERTLDAIPTTEFSKVHRVARRKPDPSDRREVVPKGCPVNVKDNRIAEIYRELRTLKLDEAPNAIAVLMRIFLEMSVDHFLENNGGALDFSTPGGGTKFKSLDKKLAETVDMLVSIGVSHAHLAAVTRSLSVRTSPLNPDLFHKYVHDRFQTPVPRELKAAWDHAQPLFEKIWP